MKPKKKAMATKSKKEGKGPAPTVKPSPSCAQDLTVCAQDLTVSTVMDGVWASKAAEVRSFVTNLPSDLSIPKAEGLDHKQEYVESFSHVVSLAVEFRLRRIGSYPLDLSGMCGKNGFLKVELYEYGITLSIPGGGEVVHKALADMLRYRLDASERYAESMKKFGSATSFVVKEEESRVVVQLMTW